MYKKNMNNTNIFQYLIFGLFTVINLGVSLGFFLFRNKTKKTSGNQDIEHRYRSYYELCIRWLNKKNQSESVSDSLARMNLSNIAIYGMGTLGDLLYEELEKSTVKVAYFVDGNIQGDSIEQGWGGIPIVNIKKIEQMPSVDAIIITPFYDFESINNDIKKSNTKLKCISINEII